MSAFETAPLEAEKQLAAQVAKNPSDVTAQLALGTTRLKLGKPLEAASAFRDALKAQPGTPAAQTLLAMSLEQGGALAEAAAVWKQVAAADSSSREAQEHLARLGDLTREPALALQARRELAKLMPTNPEVVSDLGVYLSRAGLHAEAVTTFERTAVLEPGFLERHPVEWAAYQASRAAKAASH